MRRSYAEEMRRRPLFRVWDGVAILVLLVLGVVSLLALPGGEKGGRAEVYVSGKLELTIDLGEDGDYRVQTAHGYNVLTVENGQLFVSDADCSDEICMDFGRIDRKNQSIICLPHDLTVIIISGEDDGVDIQT